MALQAAGQDLSGVLTAVWAWAPGRRARRWQWSIGGVEDELCAVFKRKPDAHLLAGRDRHIGGDTLIKYARSSS
jgi:hypothetical protein